MRILILSANTGEGHNSAARALKEAFALRGCECVIENGLMFKGALIEKIICKGHVFFYRHLAAIYGIGYRIASAANGYQKFQVTLRRSRRRAAGGKIPRRLPVLAKYIRDGGFDAVICVHVFTAQMMTQLRVCGLCDLPLYFLATDYTCSPGVNQLDVDAWIVPHAELIDEFADYGIPQERILPLGLPVRRDFDIHPGKIDARRDLGLPEDRQIVLFSCGSMGGGSMGSTVLALLEALPGNALLITVCGSNHALEQRLRKLVRSSRLMVLGYVDRMGTYMDAADLFISKPGGLSVTEAVTKRIPMMLINMVPGCETCNMRFMRHLGCASIARSMFTLAASVKRVLAQPGRLDSQAAACVRNFSGNAADRICDMVIGNLRIMQDQRRDA